MSIKSLGNGKWKIIVTKRIPGSSNKKKEATINGSKFLAQEKEHELRKELNDFVEKQKCSLKLMHSGELKTFGQCLDFYEKSGRKIKYSNFNRLKKHLSTSRLTNEIGENGIWQDLQRLTQYLLEDLAPATVNRHITMAQGAISDMVIANKIRYNYLSRFPQFPENNKTYRTLTNDERYKLFKYLPYHLKPLVFTAMLLPTRISELLLLTNKHITEDCTKIILRDGETKGNKGRWLPILPELKPYFKSIRKNNWKYVFSVDGDKRLGKWSNKDQTFQLPHKQYDLYNEACQKAEIEGYNFHKTRQQSAMQMLYDKIPEPIIMRVGGWKTHKAFYRYVDVDDRQMEEIFGIQEIWDDSWKKDLAPKAF